MSATTARQTLAAISLILFSARSRVLTKQETDELARLCNVLTLGIPDRPIYNHLTEELCESLHSSGLFDTGRTSQIHDLLQKVNAMKLLAV